MADPNPTMHITWQYIGMYYTVFIMENPEYKGADPSPMHLGPRPPKPQLFPTALPSVYLTHAGGSQVDQQGL